MAKRLLHLGAFVVSAFTIGALAFFGVFSSGAMPPGRDGSQLTNVRILTDVSCWAALIGGGMCATIVATKTAWSLYCFGCFGRALSVNVEDLLATIFRHKPPP